MRITLSLQSLFTKNTLNENYGVPLVSKHLPDSLFALNAQHFVNNLAVSLQDT